jgi:hypothetical protein
MFGLALAAQEAESTVRLDRVQEYVLVPTTKVTEPVGAPLNSAETVAVRDFNEITVVACDTVSVPGTNSNV